MNSHLRKRYVCAMDALKEKDPEMLAFSPSGGVAHAENYSEHQDWHAEHGTYVSEGVAFFPLLYV
ncbi:MAG: hypothetical protein ABI413_05050 [Ktedonobacteraceae bacterium]